MVNETLQRTNLGACGALTSRTLGVQRITDVRSGLFELVAPKMAERARERGEMGERTQCGSSGWQLREMFLDPTRAGD